MRSHSTNPFAWASITNDPLLNLSAWIILLALLTVAMITAAVIAIPVAILIGLFFLARWYSRLPAKTADMYVATEMQRQRADFLPAKEYMEVYLDRYERDCEERGITMGGIHYCTHMLELVHALYESEGFSNTNIPMRKVVEKSIQMGEYRDELLAQAKKLQDPITTIDTYTRTLSQIFLGITTKLPNIATSDHDRDLEVHGITIPLIDMLGENGKKAIEYAISPFYQSDVMELELFSRVRTQLEQNANEIDPEDVTFPTDFEGTAKEALDAYCKFTPIKDFFLKPIPWQIPQQIRFEHQWVLAPQGAGKTQLLQYQITRDIADVRDNKASVVVIDSQGDLIKLVSKIEAIPPEKLVIIEPDPLFPLALNPFDVGKDRLGTYDARLSDMLDNSAIELLTYVFDTLLGTATTPKQTALFRHCIRLCRTIPGATIHTLSNILGMNHVPFPEYMDKLPATSRKFFQELFVDPKQFAQTKQELAWRLSLMLDNRTFERMFAQPKSKLDLFHELNSSKVILINTDKSLLKAEGCELFGRFFIALLLQASQERAALERQNRLPTYVYIDECQDYIANDSNVTMMLDQARKMNVGIVLAHQRAAQVEKDVLDALTNTGIKCARAVNDAGAHVLARNMGTTPEFISKQPVGHFAIAIRNDPAMSIRIPPFVMENMPTRSPEEMKALKQRMRERYAVAHVAPKAPPPPTPDPEPPPEPAAKKAKPRMKVKEGKLVPAQEEGNPHGEAERPKSWPLR